MALLNFNSLNMALRGLRRCGSYSGNSSGNSSCIFGRVSNWGDSCDNGVSGSGSSSRGLDGIFWSSSGSLYRVSGGGSGLSGVIR
jgi:hypothetical protein